MLPTVNFVNDWREFRSDMNWQTFRFLCLEFERDNFIGEVIFTAAVAGLGLGLTFDAGITDAKRRIIDAVREKDDT